MLLKTIDKLISVHFKSNLDYQRLDYLENDVWNKIRKKEAIANTDFWELFSWNDSQLRYASIMLIAVAAIMSSQISLGSSQSNELDMNIFSANNPYMISSKLNLGED